jgi:hypothetical protein
MQVIVPHYILTADAILRWGLQCEVQQSLFMAVVHAEFGELVHKNRNFLMIIVNSWIVDILPYYPPSFSPHPFILPSIVFTEIIFLIEYQHCVFFVLNYENKTN